MTPIFCCGFECGQAGTVGQHWDLSNGGAFSTSIVRTGSRSMRFNTAGAASYALYGPTLSSNIIVLRCYLYFTTLSDNTSNLFAFRTASGYCGVQMNSAGTGEDHKLYGIMFNGVGVLTSGSFVLTTGIWYQIDFKANISANPWTVDVSVNNISVTQATIAVAASTFTTFRLGTDGNPTLDMYYDDLLISVTSADYPIGAGYVNHFVPTSDGTHNIAGAADFRRGDTTTDILNSTTDAYLLVNEVPLDDTTPDADDHIRIAAPANVTDYVECVYGPAPGINTPTVAPRAVEVIGEFFAAGTGLSDEILKLNDNGTVNNVYDGTGVAGTTTGIYKRKHYALAPTGGGWTLVAGAGNFNNIRFRYGFATDANPDKSLMCTMIEAEFDEFRHRQDDIVQPYRQKKLISPSGQKNNSNVT